MYRVTDTPPPVLPYYVSMNQTDLRAQSGRLEHAEDTFLCACLHE